MSEYEPLTEVLNQDPCKKECTRIISLVDIEQRYRVAMVTKSGVWNSPVVGIKTKTWSELRYDE